MLFITEWQEPEISLEQAQKICAPQIKDVAHIQLVHGAAGIIMIVPVCIVTADY